MKYHKIRNVPLEVCTAEQMIAYNAAFASRDLFVKQFKAQVVQLHRGDICLEFVRFCLNKLKQNEKILKKYDIDSIQCALNAGAENYLDSNNSILSSYEEVGKMFPAYYL